MGGNRMPLRRYPDPASSPDPRVRELVDALGSVQLAPGPAPQFRAELRAQLVAVTPRLVSEGVAAPAPPTGSSRQGVLARLHAGLGRARRPLTVVAGFAAVFVMLLGAAVWMSGKTLPGDSLYGVKRANENVKLSLTSGDGARGRAYLDLAQTRVHEVLKLWTKATSGALSRGPQAAGGGVSQRTGSLITDTLGDADSDTRAASRLLTGQAVGDRDAADLTTISGWAPGQIARLTAIIDAMPSGALHNRAVASRTLATRMLDRAAKLRPQLGKPCLDSSGTDDLGPLPCGATKPAPGTGGTSGTPNRGGTPGGTAPVPGVPVPGVPVPGATSGATPAGGSATGGAAPTSGRPPAGGGAPASGQAPAGGGSTSGGQVLPGVPVGTSPAPATTGSCSGVQLSLGPIGAGLSTCGVGVTL